VVFGSVIEGGPAKARAGARQRDTRRKKGRIGRQRHHPGPARRSQGACQHGQPLSEANGQPTRRGKADQEKEEAASRNQARLTRRDAEGLAKDRKEQAEPHARRTEGHGGRDETGQGEPRTAIGVFFSAVAVFQPWIFSGVMAPDTGAFRFWKAPDTQEASRVRRAC
jgi:hypothetical protein